MAEFSGYAEGTPSWVDLTTSDPDAARAFYGELFGWEFDIGTEEIGFYTMCLVRGLMVAGLGPAFPEGTPTAWTTYIATEDVDATVRRLTEANGTVMLEPMDVMDQGRMAIAADVTGAVFGLWQAGKHTGAQLANEPGAFTWNELHTRDLPAAQAFYGQVFGYGWQAFDTGEGGPAYQLLQVDERAVGGAMQMGEESPADTPPHWLTYFAVADTDAVVAAAQLRSGTLPVPAFDTQIGRIAILGDSQGAVFGVIQAPPE